jgi:hypothetical protein
MTDLVKRTLLAQLEALPGANLLQVFELIVNLLSIVHKLGINFMSADHHLQSLLLVATTAKIQALHSKQWLNLLLVLQSSCSPV